MVREKNNVMSDTDRQTEKKRKYKKSVITN